MELRSTVEPEQIGISGVQGGLRHRNPNTHNEDEHEEGNFLEQEPLTQEEGKWALAVAVSCGFDVVLGSSTIMIVAFKYAYRDGGVSLISMGFQALSHWVSSALVLLRILSELRSTSKDADRGGLLQSRRTQLHREQGLSVAMGLMLLVSSCVILFKAFRKIRFWHKWYDDLDRDRMDRETEMILDWLAWTGFGIYVLQAAIRCIGSSKARIQMLSHSAVVSIISLLYLLVLGIASAQEKEWSWKAEPIAAIVLVVVTLVEGIRIVFMYLDDMDTRLRHSSRA